MTLKLPKIIGHRGACGYAPENTLESIKAAAEMGCEWVELDVKLTKDCVPVIFHDETLERTTNGSGNMADITFAELQSLEAGSWYGDSFAGIKIPTLEEAIDVILKHKLGLNLEIKPCPGREVETAEVAMDHLSRIWDDPQKLLISSFQHVSLETCHELSPDWKRALLMDAPLKNWRELADHLDVCAININGRDMTLTQEGVEEYIDTGRLVCAYTINDPARAKTLFSWGVDAVFSDVPDIIEGLSRTRH
jgi:glycerophosphoryl diester phosphodiesterase